MLCRVIVNGLEVAAFRVGNAGAFVNVVWTRWDPTSEEERWWLPRFLLPAVFLFLDAVEWMGSRRRLTQGNPVRARDYHTGVPRTLVVGGAVGGSKLAYHLSAGDHVRVHVASEDSDADMD
jgi:hypothetical protein